jgi:hypothetical protein
MVLLYFRYFLMVVSSSRDRSNLGDPSSSLFLEEPLIPQTKIPGLVDYANSWKRRDIRVMICMNGKYSMVHPMPTQKLTTI